jgi:hypothetical protein
MLLSPFIACISLAVCSKIEPTINLVKELGDFRYKLVISHEAGDEGLEYAELNPLR